MVFVTYVYVKVLHNVSPAEPQCLTVAGGYYVHTRWLRSDALRFGTADREHFGRLVERTFDRFATPQFLNSFNERPRCDVSAFCFCHLCKQQAQQQIRYVSMLYFSILLYLIVLLIVFSLFICRSVGFEKLEKILPGDPGGLRSHKPAASLSLCKVAFGPSSLFELKLVSSFCFAEISHSFTIFVNKGGQAYYGIIG